MFHPDDDPVLDYLEEEGQGIEPQWYCPIMPTVLVNGADGIGTGWSTSVPNYNPRDIIRNMQRMLRGESMEDMSPWYKGFRGSITPNEKEPGKFDLTGCIEKVSDTTLVITELPVRTWTQSYKEFLEELMPQEGKKK
jgi:DNA topoisomerase-2